MNLSKAAATVAEAGKEGDQLKARTLVMEAASEGLDEMESIFAAVVPVLDAMPHGSRIYPAAEQAGFDALSEGAAVRMRGLAGRMLRLVRD